MPKTVKSPTKAAAKPAAAPKAAASKKLKKVVKRPSKKQIQVAEIKAAVLAYVAKRPGTVAEPMRQALGLDALRCSYVLRQLRDSKHLKGKGTTRAMTYTVTAKQFKGL